MINKSKRIVSRNAADRRGDSTVLWYLDRVRNRLFVGLKGSLQHIENRVGPTVKKRVVFISGVQRSGTNLVMDVLERSFATDVFHESDTRAFNQYELRDAGTLKRLVAESSAHVVIFKALCECHCLDYLIKDFSGAKAVWVYRDFNEVVRSHVRLWSGMPNSIAEIVSGSGTAGWRGRDLSEETLSILRSHYSPGLSNETACALFWYMRNIRFFEQNLFGDPRVLLMPYSTLIGNPIQSFSKLFSFLNIKFSPRFVSRVSILPAKNTVPPHIDPSVYSLCANLQYKLDAQSTIKP